MCSSYIRSSTPVGGELCSSNDPDSFGISDSRNTDDVFHVVLSLCRTNRLRVSPGCKRPARATISREALETAIVWIRSGENYKTRAGFKFVCLARKFSAASNIRDSLKLLSRGNGVIARLHRRKFPDPRQQPRRFR